MIEATLSRTARRGLVLIAAAVLAGGCSHSQSKAGDAAPTATASTPIELSSYTARFWRPVLESDCGKRLRPGLPAGRRYVYFSCQPANAPQVPAAAARVLSPRDSSPRRALRLLLGGPTRAERAAGFVSTFGPKTKDLGFRLSVNRRSGLAVVDFDPAIMKVEFIFVSVSDVAQIVSTVGQFPQVKRVAILVGGVPLCRKIDVC